LALWVFAKHSFLARFLLNLALWVFTKHSFLARFLLNLALWVFAKHSFLARFLLNLALWVFTKHSFLARFLLNLALWVFTKHSFLARFLVHWSSYFETAQNKRFFGQRIVLLIWQFKWWISSLCFAKHEVYKLSRNIQIHFVLAVTSTSLCNISFRNCEFWLLFLSIGSYLACTKAKFISSDGLLWDQNIKIEQNFCSSFEVETWRRPSSLWLFILLLIWRN